MPKKSAINKDVENAIKNALREAEDFKERIMAINAAIKWEAVKAKMADADFGAHFLGEDEDETELSGTGD